MFIESASQLKVMELLQLSRHNLRTLIGLFTAHYFLKKDLSRIVTGNDVESAWMRSTYEEKITVYEATICGT